MPRARVEAVDGLEQPDARNLHEIVRGILVAVVAAGEPLRERQKALEQLVTRAEIAEALVALEQPLDAPGTQGHRLSRGR